MASAVVNVDLRNPLDEDNVPLDTLLRLGPVQPKGITFKSTSFLVGERLKSLKFQDAWYEGRPWMEYSREADAACCFYCRLFKPKVNGECRIDVILSNIHISCKVNDLSVTTVSTLRPTGIDYNCSCNCTSIYFANMKHDLHVLQKNWP